MSERPLFHFSYHKCLTVYFARVMKRVFVTVGMSGISSRYKQLQSKLEQLPSAQLEYRLVSLNNHFVELRKFGDFRATRFVRDPRDLLVSGYYYHRRGAEFWCNIQDPTASDWSMVNGTVPPMPAGMSFSEYLNKASLEEGLLAELEFRRNHFDSMARWPTADPRILTLSYEEIVGNEVASFDRILRHYGVAGYRRILGKNCARRFSARAQLQKTTHIRNSESGQWKAVLTPTVITEFEKRHGDAIERYGVESR